MPPSVTTEAKTLKPCPFCGTDAGLYPSVRWPGGGKPYAIDCVGCGIDFVPREGLDVIAAWNRRTVNPSILSIIEDMAKALEPFADQAETFDSVDGKEFFPDQFEPAIVGHTIGDLRKSRSAISRYTEFMEQNNA